MAASIVEILEDAVAQRRRVIKHLEDRLSWEKAWLKRDAARLAEARERQAKRSANKEVKS